MGNSKKSVYRDKTGRIIPDDHFENEPGPPVPLNEFMSEADIAEFDAETERMREEMLLREQKPKTKKRG